MNPIPTLHQNRKTFFGRYWPEFQVLRQLKAGDPDLSVLSFGCSSGEELLTVQALFPMARIFGCDTNHESLSSARALLKERAIVFESTLAELKTHGPYDIILCNSVLMNQPALKDGKIKGIDPALWSDVIATLDENLKPGGILQIINSHIPFRFHPIYSSYTPVESGVLLGASFVDQFDLSGNHLALGRGGTGWSAILPVHYEAPASDLLRPSDLTHVHFFKGPKGDAPDGLNHHLQIKQTPEKTIASGELSYIADTSGARKRRATYLAVNSKWVAHSVDEIRITRSVKRVWFDGTAIPQPSSTLDYVGVTATAFIETALGREQTFIGLSQIARPDAIKAPSFLG